MKFIEVSFHGSDPDECHSQEYEGQVKGFGAKVPLSEYQGSADERYYDRTSADQ